MPRPPTDFQHVCAAARGAAGDDGTPGPPRWETLRSPDTLRSGSCRPSLRQLLGAIRLDHILLICSRFADYPTQLKCTPDNPIILTVHFHKEVLDNQAICDTDFDVLISAAAAYDLGNKNLRAIWIKMEPTCGLLAIQSLRQTREPLPPNHIRQKASTSRLSLQKERNRQIFKV